MIADIDGDGKMDVLASGAGGVRLFTGNGDRTLRAAISLLETQNAYHLAVADLDHDGHPDVLAVGDTDLFLLLNDGSGRFSRTTKSVPSLLKKMILPSYMQFAVADFNRDGFPDVAAYDDSDNLSIYSFSRAGGLVARHPLVIDATGFAAGDFNRDGNPDLVWVTSWAGSKGAGFVSVALGRGDGTFGPPIDLVRGGQLFYPNKPFQVRTGDFDGDGADDIQIADAGALNVDYGGRVHRLRSRGDGTFTVSSADTNGDLSQLVLGDFDGDGRPDIATNSAGLLVVRTRKDGSMGTDPHYVAGEIAALATGDLDGDGRDEIVAATNLSTDSDDLYDSGSLLLVASPDAAGRFDLPALLPTSSDIGYLATADLDRDGKPDLVASGLRPGNTVSEELWLSMRNLGGARFAGATGAGIGVGAPGPTTLGDFDGDGFPDLALGFEYGLELWLRHGDHQGGFGPVTDKLPGADSIAIGDFDSDGRLDLVAIAPKATSFSIRPGRGDGTFGAPATWDGCPGPLVAADFDTDGKLDLAYVDHCDGTVSVRLGRGDLRFRRPIVVAHSASAVALLAADFDGDSQTDLALLETGGPLTLFRGEGGGQFGVLANLRGGPAPGAMAVADLNGDGSLDLAVTAGGSHGIRLLLNHGNGCFTSQYLPSTARQALTVEDVDGDGRIDLLAADYTGIHVLLNATPW